MLILLTVFLAASPAGANFIPARGATLIMAVPPLAGIGPELGGGQATFPSRAYFVNCFR